jgi:hypothetical protein
MLKKIFAITLSVSILLGFALHSKAQSALYPLDLMVVIDNSGSMFPAEFGYSTCCSDPGLFRIAGTELFLARLGFAEENEGEYQIGIISMGDSEDMLISPLRPVRDIRDSLAAAIQNPKPESETHLIDALKLAYQELQNSPNRKPGNTPAIVLLTDGVPTPVNGQGNSDIENLISEHKDIPVFIMLLQGEKNANNDEYKNYIDFWKKLQLRSSSLFVYEIQGSAQIEQTYNKIIAQLQNTIPTPLTTLQPGVPYPIYVNTYVQKIIVTVIRDGDQSQGKVEIKDSKGEIVLDTDTGVAHFQGNDNHVEVISISAPRLSDNLKDGEWTITSDQTVRVFLDRFGAYQINLQSPPVSFTDLNNVYIATQRVNPRQDFDVRFQLKLEDGTIVKEPQPIQGEVLYPNGQEGVLLIPSDLKPDADGGYHVSLNFTSLYPDVLNTPGRFILTFMAGSADPNVQDRVPIATTKLLVDVGLVPYLEFSPSVDCAVGQPVLFKVKVGDFQTVSSQDANLRVFDPNGADVSLQLTGTDEFEGDLSSLCKAATTALSCSQSAQTTFNVRLVAQMTDGSPLSSVEKPLSVNLMALPCTPLPPTVTPLPPPTPIPDTDVDTWVDPADQCPTVPRWSSLDYFDGCPPPMWLLILLGLIGTGLLAFFVFYLWPLIKITWIVPPPKAFVCVCRNGKDEPSIRNIHAIGLNHRTNKVTIGKDKQKAHIHIPELKESIEFAVVMKDGKIVLQDCKTGASKSTFEETPKLISVNNEIALRIGTDQMKMRSKR